MFWTVEAENLSPDFFEFYRYAGYPPRILPEKNIISLAEECVKEMQPLLRPKIVYEKFSKEYLEYIIRPSKNLSKNLEDCTHVILFAATIGSEVDSLIRKTEKIDAAKAGLMHSCGAMFIEEFVNQFNNKIKEEYSFTKPRYSPGYGDVPLEVQIEFFRLLPCSKISLSLMDTMIMAPEKSVTAFIGIKE